MRPVHRLVYELECGEIGDLEVDHLCHTRDCVRVDHMRAATHQENMRNLTGENARNTSGYRGVYWHKRFSKWVGCVGHEGRIIHVGYFDSPEVAAQAVTVKRAELHGELRKVSEG